MHPASVSANAMIERTARLVERSGVTKRLVRDASDDGEPVLNSMRQLVVDHLGAFRGAHLGRGLDHGVEKARDLARVVSNAWRRRSCAKSATSEQSVQAGCATNPGGESFRPLCFDPKNAVEASAAVIKRRPGIQAAHRPDAGQLHGSRNVPNNHRHVELATTMLLRVTQAEITEPEYRPEFF